MTTDSRDDATVRGSLGSVASLGSVYGALTLAAARSVGALSETPHPRVGRVAAALWLDTLVLGLVVPW